jgi:hypothetical protein
MTQWHLLGYRGEATAREQHESLSKRYRHRLPLDRRFTHERTRCGWGCVFDEPNCERGSEGHKDSTKGVTMKTDGTKKKSAPKIQRPSQPGTTGKTLARPDKPVIEELELKPAVLDPFDVPDEPPISMAPRVKKLAWSYSLLREVDHQAIEDLHVEAGTKIAIEGTLERLGYLYVVQIGDDKSIEILFPPSGGPRRARPGMNIRLPSGTGWIVTTKKGKLRTVTSAQPLSEAELAALI